MTTCRLQTQTCAREHRPPGFAPRKWTGALAHFQVRNPPFSGTKLQKSPPTKCNQQQWFSLPTAQLTLPTNKLKLSWWAWPQHYFTTTWPFSLEMCLSCLSFWGVLWQPKFWLLTVPVDQRNGTHPLSHLQKAEQPPLWICPQDVPEDRGWCGTHFPLSDIRLGQI